MATAVMFLLNVKLLHMGSHIRIATYLQKNDYNWFVESTLLCVTVYSFIFVRL